MRHFAELYSRLDETTSTNRKVAALVEFFRSVPEEEKMWALALLWGKYRGRRLPSRLVREKVAQMAKVPLWLVEESYSVVGDLAETIALLLPKPKRLSNRSLPDWIAFLESIRESSEGERLASLEEAWEELDGVELFLFNKLITGGFRVGTGRGIVAKALAEYTGYEQATIAHRLLGEWLPQSITFSQLLDAERLNTNEGQPYPFFLASGFEAPSKVDAGFLKTKLGDETEWLAEWKWDGIRGQLILRGESVVVWSRGEEILTDRFPEFHGLASSSFDGEVLDGEIICMQNGRPLSFHLLQKRISRKRVTSDILQEAPVAFLAYDLLEHRGRDIRTLPLVERRKRLEDTVSWLEVEAPLKLSPLISFESWVSLTELHQSCREHNAEGFMLKRATSEYQTGRKRGDWWKWKTNPYTVDAVLIYAQRGHGRRANLYTDFTFGVWNNDQLVTFAKAYSGLSDDEMKEVDRFVKRNTLEKFGPVRTVKPELVFEIAFEGIQPSSRHKSGVAVRFPRISRWRKDKKPRDADSLESLKHLMPDS